MTSTLQLACRNCGAQAGEPCEHDAGCTDRDRDHLPLPDALQPWPVGQPVQVECPDGWRPGRVDGYRIDLTEDLVRVDVQLAPGHVVRGAHPKHVRAA